MTKTASHGSEIGADEIVRSLAAARIDFSRGGVDQVAIGIKRAEQPRFVQSHGRLHPLQRVFAHEEGSLHRAVVSPKPDGAPRGIIGAALILKFQRADLGALFMSPVARIFLLKSLTASTASFPDRGLQLKAKMGAGCK